MKFNVFNNCIHSNKTACRSIRKFGFIFKWFLYCHVSVQLSVYNSNCHVGFKFFVSNLKFLIEIRFFAHNLDCHVGVQLFIRNSDCYIVDFENIDNLIPLIEMGFFLLFSRLVSTFYDLTVNRALIVLNFNISSSLFANFFFTSLFFRIKSFGNMFRIEKLISLLLAQLKEG